MLTLDKNQASAMREGLPAFIQETPGRQEMIDYFAANGKPVAVILTPEDQQKFGLDPERKIRGSETGQIAFARKLTEGEHKGSRYVEFRW